MYSYAGSFPRYDDGNVEIHLSKRDTKYVLYFTQLALPSGWFKKALSGTWRGSAQQQSILNGGKKHWVFELKFKKGEADGSLWLKCAVNEPKTEAMEMVGSISDKLPAGTDAAAVETHEQRIKCIKAHQMMITALCNLRPVLSHSSFDSAKSSILDLAKVAKYYVCEPVIQTPVGLHLLKYQAEVLERCADQPIPMLELAMTVKSEWVFMEAATHLLGRNQEDFVGTLPELGEMGIAELMKTKRNEFVRKLEQTENNLLRIRFNHVPLGSASPLALAYFRDWLSTRLSEWYGSSLQPSYACVYRQIYQCRDGMLPAYHSQ